MQHALIVVASGDLEPLLALADLQMPYTLMVLLGARNESVARDVALLLEAAGRVFLGPGRSADQAWTVLLVVLTARTTVRGGCTCLRHVQYHRRPV